MMCTGMPARAAVHAGSVEEAVAQEVQKLAERVLRYIEVVIFYRNRSRGQLIPGISFHCRRSYTF